MTTPTFAFTNRARPFLQIGIGDTRIPTGQAPWNVAKWDDAAALWAGTEPVWLDFPCETFSARCEYGRQRSTDRFVAGAATVIVNNTSGWADPYATTNPASLDMRPGRAIRFGVEHVTFGRCVLFRGFIDAIRPTYEAGTSYDEVEMSCLDALGEVNRAKIAGRSTVVGAGESADVRVGRILTLAQWPPEKTVLAPSATALVGDELNGQVADLLGQAADSAGGVVFGDHDASIVFRPRDWQTYPPGTPPAATIGNVEPADVCPVSWVRPFARADIATRAIFGRDVQTAVVVDDVEGQRAYGVEPFERTDLLTQADADLLTLAQRALRVRGYATAPVVRGVSLNAATSDGALDVMSTADPFAPTLYRCRLELDRGPVFDGKYYVTGLMHEMTRNVWALTMNLDDAAPFEAVAGRWDGGLWDRTVWADAV